MKKLLALLICWTLVVLPSARAQETIYGGVPASRYVTTSEVIWFQSTNVLTQAETIVWTYTMQCKGGSSSPAGSPYLYVSGSTTLSITGINSGGSGGGFGQFFPCNGWVIQATFGVGNSNTDNGQLYQQALILNAVPCAGGLVPSGTFTLSVAPCNIVQSTIEQCLIGALANSFFTFSYPGAGCVSPGSGNGFPLSVTVSNPASATNFQQALSAFFRVRIINVQYTLTVSATGNHFACINWLTGGVSGTVIGRNCSRYAQTNGGTTTTVIYNFSNAVGGYTNCSLMGSTQTAVQCPEMDVPIGEFWDFTPAETPAINSSVVTETGANALSGADAITNITIRELVWHSVY